MKKEVKDIISIARNYAKKARHQYITEAHLLYGALNLKEVKDVLSQCTCTSDIEFLTYRIRIYLEKMPVLKKTTKPIKSAGYQRTIKQAKKMSRKITIEAADILIPLYEEETFCSQCLFESVRKFTLLWALSLGREKDQKIFFKKHLN
jgi:ATP-dependent Clp protease ATP-binding subunit ClpA